jgi:hypothetical protein
LGQVVDLSQSQAGPYQHPARTGPQGGTAGAGELVHPAVPAGRVLETVLPILHPGLGHREVSHAVMMVDYPDRFGPHFAAK